ncbi:MAG: DegT/DnrJ/EryC1/StrS family aminotransferase [Candidatus Heimdallarchaeota archaeon]|nr:MAG: DegT/DnrJ/EryC1/StrS family aminotransferase [Candidatus Heimdallarchaeota archaeon]
MKYIAQPQVSEEEISLVAQTIRSKSFVEGENARTLEKEFAKFVGAKHAICTVNGTAALHLALEGLNIPPGAEVITSAFTFIASANAICFGGGIPIFADINPSSFNIDPEKIKPLINPKTKCLMPVHIFGLPADMKAILDIAEDNNLTIIEDACQAHGSRIDGKHSGTFGDIGCFSFYATKNMISGEGGMVVTNNDELAERIRSLKNHGRGPSGGYHHHIIAYNFRLADPLAAIGLIQLRKLPKMLEQRQKNAEMIRSTIKELDSLRVQVIPTGITHGHYVCAPVIENPRFSVDEVIKRLNNLGIGARRIYSVPCHQQPTYLDGIKHWRWNEFVNYPDYSNVNLPVTEKISRSHFEVPIHPGVNSEEIVVIQNALKEIFS